MNFTLKKSDLNFKVYTVPTKPTAPGVENDIAIISSVPMKNWVMSPDNPYGIPRNDGDVWIKYSTKGDTFNALKQNTLMITAISAWQYVGGAWVDQEAVSCQGGAWVDWVRYLYLFNDGDNIDITGGWNNSAGTITVGSTIYFSAAGSNNTVYYASTNNKIDIGEFSKINIVASDVDVAHGNNDGRHFIYFATGSRYSPTKSQKIYNANEIYTLDVSAYKGTQVYVGIGTNNAPLTISKIWLQT